MKSIRSRLIFYVIFSTIIPVLAFLVYNILFVNEGFRDTEIDANQTKIDWSVQYLEQLVSQIDDVVYSLHLEEDLLLMVDDTQSYSETIEDLVKSTLYNNSNILSRVSVISTNTYKGVSFDYENGFNSNTYLYDDLGIEPSDEAFGLKFLHDGSNILVMHTINEFATQNLEGIIILKLSNDVLDELENIFGDDANYILNTSQTDLVVKEEFDTTKLHELDNSVEVLNGSMIWHERINNYDLFISHIVPVNEINSFSRNMFGVGLIIILTSFGITVAVSILFTNDVTSPVIALASHMESNELVEYKNQKQKYQELSVLESAYNSMVKEINELITDKYKNEIERQSIQLKALQAQINPHFLSNTFQLIGGMALEKEAGDIYEATIKMSKLVRYSMRIDQKAVPLDEELEHISLYLDIQKLRFGDRLTYDVDIDSEVKSYMIPKFTIQPIIENSFKYGLKKLKGVWEIKIRSSKSDSIYISIEDNGVGLDQNLIDSMNAMFDSEELSIDLEKDKKSVGLANINARIRLLYGKGYGLRFEKAKNNGACVVIKLPFNGVKK